ncbi:hypothetical protein C2E23DRAFT_47323 [Lenzites betulinus]|nr:hypothetical protein C2E23DRAFT_47323 [Lenzites betulinus]
MWTNGNIYFFTLLSINVLDLILVALSITADNSDESYVIVFLDPINAILNCHFLLDLYEANAQIERGGPSLTHSNPTLSLHFTGSPQDSADAPEHSTFLSSFAGPVYTFRDANTDPDLADSEHEAVSGVSAQIATEDTGKEA